MRGYFGIGIENPKTIENVGTLWRSAFIMGAAFIFTIGTRIKQQCSDTVKAYKYIPYFRYDNFEDFNKSIPYDCPLIGIENIDKSQPIENYRHPERCIYLLGSEDNGLSKQAISKCKDLIILPGTYCLNVSVAGSLVLYDRITKLAKHGI